MRSVNHRLNTLLDSPRVQEFDDAIDQAFGHLRGNRVLDRIFYGASESANHSICWHAIGFGLAVSGRISWKQAAHISALLGIESALVNGPIKMLFRRKRPVVTRLRPHRLRTPRTTSFPSGHATSATVAALLLTNRPCSLLFRVTIWMYAALVAWSRAHVRIHHASDIVAGFGVGALLGLVFRKIQR